MRASLLASRTTARPVTVEVELAGRLTATAERREAERGDISRLAECADLGILADLLAAQRVLVPLGTRLEAYAPRQLSDQFRTLVGDAVAHARRRAALVEQVTLELLGRLRDAGIPAVPLKGVLFAERIYGDPGMRVSSDIDILVHGHAFRDAVGALTSAGYEPPTDRPRRNGLPLFESSLRPSQTWRPPIDLHWRLHWYESEFSESLIERSSPGERGARVPAPADELAALLLFYARDGFWGLRGALDIAAWWDVYGEWLGHPVLDVIAAAHPELRPALLAAALVAEQSVGVPAKTLIGSATSITAGARWAARLHDEIGGKRRDQWRNVMVVDWLLTPPGGRRAYVRRHFLNPPADLDAMPERAWLRRRMRLAHYAAALAMDLSVGVLEAITTVRSTH